MFWDDLFGIRFKKSVFSKLNRYKEMTFDGLKFYYRCEYVDYSAYGLKGPCRYQKHGFE